MVTIISPWNFPFALLLNPMAGALAAGNTCVLKPSEVSSACGQLIAVRLRERRGGEDGEGGRERGRERGERQRETGREKEREAERETDRESGGRRRG